MKIFNKLFMSSEFFTIAIKTKDESSIVDEGSFVADYVVPANRKKWVADPILVEDNGSTYLFYEAFYYDKARIEVAKVNDNCTLGEASVVFEDNDHYSYPFVFRFENRWYMIPETSSKSKVSLFTTDSFPYSWYKVKDLLNEKAVDTTVFEQNNQLYLLTFLPNSDSERVKPCAYSFDISDGQIQLNPLKWSEYDELKTRGAGTIFPHKGQLVRPAQSSRENKYGDNVIFYYINCDEKEYSETPAGDLMPEDIKAKNWWFDGTHTYTCTTKFEAIDIRCRKFEPLKIFRYLRKVIKK